MDAPRGRIALMRAASDGKISPDDFQSAFSLHIQRCLACRSCESACPSGVQYGALVEEARIVVENNQIPRPAERVLRWLGVQQMMTHQSMLKAIARIMWLYEKSGLQKIIRSLNFLPKTLKAMESILPPIYLQFTQQGKTYPAADHKEGAVLFFIGCIQEGFLSGVNQATIRVLQQNGYEVFVPKGQNCCGAAHLHLGDKKGAQRLAKQNIDAFPVQEYDAVICNAGGCGVSLKEYPGLLEGDPSYADRAIQFSQRVKDINEFLATHIKVKPTYPVNTRAVYSDSCHLRHGQKVIKQPRELLKQIPGLELVELSLPDRCCGSAGVYNIAQVDTANAILDAKMDDIVATGADLIVTSNTGCQMQLIAGVRRKGLNARVMHVVEVLDLSYRGNNGRS